MKSESYLIERPLISVVLAAYNESKGIRHCLDSLREQETTGFDMEILVVDGASTDGTREYLEQTSAADPRVSVLVNEKRRTPSAFNIGIREAKGSYICIFGAHAVYARDYVAVCLKELQSKNAAGCGGRVLIKATSNTLQARLAAYTFAHPFGSSRKSFRTQPEGYADTIGYMILRREPLVQVGGYSETLLRNQDNDTNQRIRGLGYKLYCTWKTHCYYQPKETIRDLFTYAYRNGFWNVISFKENPSSMGVRHFIPFFFVLSLLITLLIAIVSPFIGISSGRFFAVPFFGLLSIHMVVGTIAALGVTLRKRDAGALLLPLVFIGFHIAYGCGTLMSFVTGAKATVSSSQSPIQASMSSSQ